MGRLTEKPVYVKTPVLGTETLKDKIVAITAIIQGTIDAADRGGGSARLFGNLQIGLMILQHGGYLEALGQGEKLIDSAEIFKEIIAFLRRFQTKDCLKQMVNSVGL